RIFSLYSAVLLVGAAALCLFARELFAILVGPAFQSGYRLVPPLALAYCIFCFTNSFSQGLQAKQRMLHYAWIGAVASAVFLALCLPLVGPLGASGIIVAMGGSFLAMLIALQIVSNRLMPATYPWARHALMWLAARAIDAIDLVEHVAIVLERQKAVGNAGRDIECARSDGIELIAAPASEGGAASPHVGRHIENAAARAAHELGLRLCRVMQAPQR